MPDGFHGYGTVLKVGDGASPEVFTAVAAVASLKAPGITNGKIDASHLSVTNRRKRYIVGMGELTVVTGRANYLPANATHKNAANGMLALANSGATNNWLIVFSDDDDSEMEFSGFVTKWEPSEAANDSLVSFDFEITPDGDNIGLP